MAFTHYIKIASAVLSIGVGLCQTVLGAMSLKKELNEGEETEESTTEE